MPKKPTHDMFSLFFEAPYVIALRCQQLAAGAGAGWTENSAELQRMVSEKAEATFESLIASNVAISRLGLVLFKDFWLGRRFTLTPRQGASLVGQVTGPYAKRVRANGRRLRRH